MSSDKRTIYVGGLAEEVSEKLLNDAFIPFGDLIDVQIPVDYESQKHRGFAFIEFETAEDAAAAIDNMVRIPQKKTIFKKKNITSILFPPERFRIIWKNNQSKFS